MKQQDRLERLLSRRSFPARGTGIEMYLKKAIEKDVGGRSPHGERGLKLLPEHYNSVRHRIVPLVGTGIET